MNHTSSVTPKSSPKSKRKTNERPSTDRKTNIQVCVRVRPILPSDSKRSSSNGRGNNNSKHSLLPPHPEERMKSKVKIKIKSPKRDLLHKESSRLSSNYADSSGGSDVSDDTDPAWTVVDNEISQSEHTNPESNRNNKYRFDHSFGPSDDNQDIYENSVRDSVISAMEGYHASVFAYGQTATGKTFTMTGGGSPNANGREGVIQMAIRDCFEYIHSQKSETRESTS